MNLKKEYHGLKLKRMGNLRKITQLCPIERAPIKRKKR
jgi:hypothetical protein